MNGIRALSLAAVVAACFIFPAGATAGCLPEDPECRPAPPQTAEIRPDPRLGSVETGELADPAYVQPMPIGLPMPLPRRVGEEVASAKGGDLARAQDPTEVTCGVNALGKAMDRLGGAAPTSGVMVQYLRDRGWLYEYGTGVEELALTAQAYGYLWSASFHDWDLPRLREELAGGGSVVVSLGVNGPDAPGHFVTVTGLSADGRWVTYDDPVLGVRVVSVEEFQAEWEAQGNSGVVVRREPAGEGSGLPGEGPLVPLGMAAAALAGVVALAPLGTKRKGIGGHANPPGVAGRWVWRDEPVYAEVTEVVGYDVKREKVAKYKTVEVQEGWDVETVRVARMKTVVVQDGWDVQTERRPVYQTESYVSGYRTWMERVPEYDYIGRRRKLIGYDTVTRREAIWSMRTVVAGYQTVEKREPRLVAKEVFDHWENEDKRVPRMVPKQVPDGYDEVPVRVPIMATRSKPVGTTVKWVWEADSTDRVEALRAGRWQKDVVLRPVALRVPTPPANPPANLRETPSPTGLGDEHLSLAPVSGAPRPDHVLAATPNIKTDDGTPPTGAPNPIVKMIPSLTAIEGEQKSPIVSLEAVEVGSRSNWRAGVSANPILGVTPSRWTIRVGDFTLQVGWEGRSLAVGFRTPYEVGVPDPNIGRVSVGHSGGLRIEWDGLRTSSTAYYNAYDYVLWSADEGEPKGAGSVGIYVKQRPFEEGAAALLAQTVAGGLIAFGLLGVPLVMLPGLMEGALVKP